MATSSGPTDVPRLPPTWKMDCAMPLRPCDASDVMREASGCSVAEPMPTMATATNTAPSDPAKANSTMPVAVQHMPAGRLRTNGRRSNT